MRALVHALLFLLATPALAERTLTDADFLPVDPDKARIGQLLFYDKILSGNRNISCGTCHHHDHAGTDGLSLGIGEGGSGVGPERTAGTGPDRIRKRIPRNAPALWNLGHRDITVLFHDGRLSLADTYENRFDSPAEEWLPDGLDDIVAAQAIFPLVAQFEMAGNPSENEIAGAVHDRIDAAWPILAKRVRTIPEYGEMFTAAFDTINAPEDVTITEIGNALSAFIRHEWRNHDSPYDVWLSGDPTALSADAAAGRALFFGAAGCSSCHNGPLLTDQKFHAIALPAFGPGRTRPFDPYPRDVGHMGESDRLDDAYRFRTPPLRNVALTGPYGHNGAYPTLEGIIRHHLAPLDARERWTKDLARLPEAPWLAAVDFPLQQDPREETRQRLAIDIQPVSLTDTEIAQLTAFLHALTGKSAETRPLGRPETVPSGLPVD
ncbi:MAG: cytochrome c peroxidase [Pseudomonadota bacterium]